MEFKFWLIKNLLQFQSVNYIIQNDFEDIDSVLLVIVMICIQLGLVILSNWIIYYCFEPELIQFYFYIKTYFIKNNY